MIKYLWDHYSFRWKTKALKCRLLNFKLVLQDNVNIYVPWYMYVNINIMYVHINIICTLGFFFIHGACWTEISKTSSRSNLNSNWHPFCSHSVSGQVQMNMSTVIRLGKQEKYRLLLLENTKLWEIPTNEKSCT